METEKLNKLFDEAYSLYPKKLGKKQAYKCFKRDIKTEEDYAKLVKAIKNYTEQLIRMKTEYQFIKHASTFFNNWEDYAEMDSEETLTDMAKKIWSFE